MDYKAQEFLKLYNELDALLQKRYNDFDRNHSQIMRYSSELSRSSYIKTAERGRKLNLIRQIRNLMIHDLDMNNDGLISISQELIDILAYEVKILNNPVTAYKICSPIGKLIKGDLEAKITDTFSKMAEAGYMQLPVIDPKGKLIGVISPNALLVYLTTETNITENSKVKEMLPYLPIDKHICEHYGFIAKEASVDEATDLFQKYTDKGKKLVMVFVTEHGKEDEAVLGILTAYDIVHLMD